MGLFGRRNKDLEPPAPAAPDHAKSLIITEDLSETISNFGFPFDSAYGMLYRRQPAVRTVVDFLARNIAQLGIKTYLRLDRDDRIELDDHPLAILLRKPSPSMTPYRLLYALVADKAIHDRAYWVKNGAPIESLTRLPPSRLLRRRSDNGTSIDYRTLTGKTIDRASLVIFSGYTPDANWNDEDGVSPMETLRRTLAEEFASQQNREHFWKNAARQGGAIQRPIDAPEWSPEARQRFRTDLENVSTGATNAGRTLLLEDGMVWNGSAFSPRESEYIAGRQLTRDEVALAYGINPQLFKGESANANIESFHRHLYQDTLGPWLRDIEDTIELELLPDLEVTVPAQVRGRTYIEFNLAEKLKGSFEEQARSLTTTIGVPWMTVNEGRAIRNLPRIDDPAFDMPIQPLNVMYGGQAATTLPTDVPQPKRRSKKTAPAGALRRRNEAAKAHEELFRRYFNAQRKAVKAKAASFDMDRWNGKLTGELYAARVSLAGKTGKLAAKQIGGVYDEARTLNYLQEGARREADRVNAQTIKALADAADDEEAIAQVWDEAATSRSSYLGLTTAVEVINFARHEAAYQSSQDDGKTRTKTWVVTSDNSRHPEMDGENVGLDDAFSNGAAYPGDASAGVDETAGCSCLLSID